MLCLLSYLIFVLYCRATDTFVLNQQAYFMLNQGLLTLLHVSC
jgi:hypothetical protein